MTCPICGEKDGACHSSVPVRLTADQLADIGLKPEQLEPGGTIAMADQDEPKARYPKQDVAEGQKAGYIGEVEVYDPKHSEPGYSNSGTQTTRKTARDSTPDEPAIAGDAGLVGGTIDNVSPPKSR